MSDEPDDAGDLAARTLRLRAWVANQSDDADGIFAGWAEPEIAFLGQGESYEAWSVRHGEGHLVVRIARRPPAEMPLPMEQELAALSRLPDDVGPRVLAHAADDPALGAASMVVTFLPGAVLDGDAWTDDLLARHAARMARLHASTAQAVTAEPVETPLQRYESTLRWFGSSGAPMDDAFAALAAPVRDYLAQREPLSAVLDRACLVHGDLVVPNILVDDAGEPRYVDWEWSRAGDPAQDLGFIGGAVVAEPWHVPLGRDRARRFVLAYLDAVSALSREDADRWGGPDELLARRDAWHVAEVFTSGLYYTTLRGAESDRTHGDRYTRATSSIADGLTRLLST